MKTDFGTLKDGRKVSLYTIENETIKMQVMDYGATLVSYVFKPTNTDIVEGFENVDGYQDQTSYIGASIGRTANRIEKGKFKLNGKEYTVPINNNGNCNHGGLEGFDKKIWKAGETNDSVVFTYTSNDGEEGYPGTLHVAITYKLLENGIAIISEGKAEEDTLFAYTNHSYFNLDESEDAMSHEVKIYSDRYALSDANGLTLNEFESVENTPFDFRDFKKLSEDINEDNEQLTFGKGYDHHYPIMGEGMKIMAECKGKQLILTAFSDFPGMHLYSANWLENKTGKKGRKYPERSAVCFEAEYMPNAINYEDVKDKPIVKKGETLRHEIRYLVKER